MPVDLATVVITAPVPYVVNFLAQPGNVQRYMSGAVAPGSPLSSHARVRSAGMPARWAFAAEPAAHRFRWWLLAPYRAAGSLHVYGDCTVSQLWLAVESAPAGALGEDAQRAARAVLHRIRRCVETDLALRRGDWHRQREQGRQLDSTQRAAPRPVLLRTA